jgi:hypothetical protein
MAVNDIYRLRVHCRLHGGEVINVWHFVEDLPAPAGAQTLADDVRDNMGTTLRARASNEMVFEYVEAVKLVPYGDGPVTAPWPGGTLGTAAGNCATGTVCEVITVYTSQIGRRHRGRMYLSGLLGTRMSSGLATTTQTTATQAFATAFATRYMVVGHPGFFSFGIWSRVIAGPDPPWPTDAFTRATSLTVRTILRNQRRRQIGVGR